MSTPSPQSVRRAVAPLVALFVLALSASPAQAQLGVAGGLAFESAGDIQTSTTQSAALENSTGYHIGVVYEIGAGPVSIRPGFFYRRVGTYEFRGQTGAASSSYDVSTYEIPVDVRLTVLPTPVLSPYVLAGPMASFPTSSDEFDEALEDYSVSGNIGAGVEISLPAVPFTLQPELRYEFGLTKFADDDDLEIGDRTVSLQEEPKFSAFSVRLHVLF